VAVHGIELRDCGRCRAPAVGREAPLLLLTGLRRGELLNAKWSDIDWKQRTLSVPKTKNGEALLAPLSHAAISRLKVVPQLQGNPYIICGKKLGQHSVALPLPCSQSAPASARRAETLGIDIIHDFRALWLRLACGDNALAQDSKTCMRIRIYKAAHQKPSSRRHLSLPQRRASEPHARVRDH
jgi:integrase